MTRIIRTTRTTGGAGANALRAGLTVAAFAASGALVLTACSSSSGSSSSASASGSPAATASASASGNRGQAMTAYRDCLSQHGLKLPSFAPRSPGARPSGSPGAGRGFGGGGFGGGGRGFGGGGFPGFGGASPDAATQKALDACKSLQPQFSGRGGAGGANSSAFKAFTSCLKDHGVVLPTPSPGATNGAGRPGGGFGFRGLNTSDPKTAKAYDACKVLLPQRSPGSGAGAPSPSATT
ncbi:hypothetical protein [Actinacidiphila acididurans]|uniref:Uncharacterized protein n=1 Tax=Actinacidiphila acididurans TaxID=2784346 RepID=A0ABS2U2P3_9ACTN|nr:hypothetical protein [Actinacidiphila acididurans]MBM9509021.1 hypothetical protein [Actinacidiphila acididurans]